MGRHAILIIAHDNFSVLERLIKALSHPDVDIYLHIDAKVKSAPSFDKGNPNLYLLSHRIDTRWGDFSQIETEYVLLETALSHGEYAFYHIISGTHFLALDGIQDPGNMGTMIRTADAAGFDGLLLSPDCVDIFSPKVLRATMGSIFRMSFAFPESLPSALLELREKDYSILSSQLDGDPFYSRNNVSSSFVLIVGNEGNGISDPVKSVATHHLCLPMRGGAESLNAAVAAGIMMYDLMKNA